MDSDGFLWILIDCYGLLWIPIDFYGFLMHEIPGLQIRIIRWSILFFADVFAEVLQQNSW